MSKHFNVHETAAGAGNSRAMESRDHSKNGVSLKNQRSKGNFLIGCVLVLAFCGGGNKAMAQYSGPWDIGHNPVEGGDYLPNVKATLNGNTLTINGNGNMADFWCTGANQYDAGGEAPWWFNHRNDVKTVVFQGNVQNIGMRAFKDCINLESIDIPSSITKINAQAFKDCHELTAITIPSRVTEIGGEAFLYCSKLETVIIKGENNPPTLNFMGYFSFATCLPSPAGGDTYDWFKGCPIQDLDLGRNFSYHNSVYGDNSPFREIETLQSLIIRNTVKEIEVSAFVNCDILTNVTIEDGGSWLTFNTDPTWGGGPCFDGSPVANLHLGRSIKFSLGTHPDTFKEKPSLTHLTIGKDVEEILDETFYGCRELKEITSYPKPPKIHENTFNGVKTNITKFIKCAYWDNYTTEAEYWKDFTNYQYIDDEDFPLVWDIGNNLTATFCNGTLRISGAGAMPDGDNTIPLSPYEIIKVIIEDDVTAIGDENFKWCSNLVSVRIGNSVKSIGYWAFANCTSLDSITIPNSVVTIKYGSFENCLKLALVNIGDNTKNGSSLTSIEKWAFKMCNNLTSITIPSSVEYIGGEAFFGCCKLEVIFCYPDKPPQIEDDTFEGCGKSKSIYDVPVLIYCDYITDYQTADYWEKFTDWRGFDNIPCVVSITELESNKISVYPNPVNDELTITNYAGEEVEIYDLMGRRVAAAAVETHGSASLQSTPTTTINVEFLPSGIYFIKIGEKTAKFVKE